MSVISVALPVPIFRSFDYILPKNKIIKIGSRVQVPFKNRKIIGIVVKIESKNGSFQKNLKQVDKIIDYDPIFSISLWKMLNWSSKYYHFPLGKTLFYSVPKLLRTGKSIESKENQHIPEKIFKHSKEILHYTRKNNSFNSSKEKKIICSWKNDLKIKEKKLELNKEQTFSVNSIINRKNVFSPWLLFGVTGSGKTEVYLRTLEYILKEGKQALILIPEISLAPQTLNRFQNRFSVPIDVLHSKLNERKKLLIWENSFYGKNAILIGTRSALFTPFLRLGIIILDEEHDSSYKQKTGFRYHARDLAVFRAKLENIPIILGTATPSFETLYNVRKKKYFQLNLKKRAGLARPVSQNLLNMKEITSKNGLSTILRKKIYFHLKSGNQVLIFLNQRGFSKALFCKKCNWIAECKQCDKRYTVHKNKKKLCCHYCENKKPLYIKCPVCLSSNLKFLGIGTERLEKLFLLFFPNFPLTRIDRDTVETKGSLEKKLQQIKERGARILIGTQMLAKGHHFPNVTLVAILNIDCILFSNDFRAAEKFAQLYLQVSGRSGRSEKIGEVFLQTYFPNHPLLKILLKQDYFLFSKYALKERKKANLPPFVNHCAFLANDHDNKQASSFLKKVYQLIINSPLYIEEIWIIGPSPALLPKRCGRFYWQLILSHPSRRRLQKIIFSIFPSVYLLIKSKKVKWSLDVDPIDY